jgi:Na+/melibiose symporter-like transporter
MTTDERQPGWRQVLAVGALIVAGVLALQVISAYVPALDTALGDFPTIIVVLVVVTIAVVVIALRPRTR